MVDEAVPDPDGETEGIGSAVGWLELFFDLVVVAAIAVLTSGLEGDPSLVGMGMFLLLFGAIWLTWTSIVLYANLAKVGTRTTTVVIAMFLIAMMAASAPTHFEHRANYFAAGFLITRFVVARSSMHTGRVLAAWPLLQFGGLALPWIVAMWVPAPWKYWLWALGLVADLLFTLLRGKTDDATLAAMMGRMEQRSERRQRHGRDGSPTSRHPDDRPSRGLGRNDDRARPARPRRSQPTLVAVDVDTGHLDERLGVFVIIVLGEAVSQLVLSAATTDWDNEGFEVTVVVAFLILVGLWWLTFSYGFTAAPHTRLATLPPRFGLPLHLLTTVGIVCLAAGLGAVSSEPDGVMSTGLRWVMCAGLSVHFLATGIAGVSGGAPWKWVTFWAAPGVLVPIALAVWGGRFSSEGMVWVLFAVVGWQLVYGQRGAALARWRASSADPVA